MKENILLNRTLEIYSEDGPQNAYQYLETNLDTLNHISSQVYNFLYCLAATTGQINKALDWMEDAIVNKGLWYRPEVFEDEDLDGLKNIERFNEYIEISYKRYSEALEVTQPQFTWKRKESDNLLVVMHGNQQNNEISKEYWSTLMNLDYQIEYLQSEEIDSYKLYRWNDNGNGPDQLNEVLKSTKWKEYNQRVLAGFSAGCNTILRTLKEKEISTDKIIMISPWIPCINNDIDEIITILADKQIEILILCGENDSDCLPLCKDFDLKSKEKGLLCKTIYIKDHGHDYPEDFHTFVKDFL